MRMLQFPTVRPRAHFPDRLACLIRVVAGFNLVGEGLIVVGVACDVFRFEI